MYFFDNFIFLLQINLNLKLWNQAVRKYYCNILSVMTPVSQFFKCTFHTRFIMSCLVDHLANLIMI